MRSCARGIDGASVAFVCVHPKIVDQRQLTCHYPTKDTVSDNKDELLDT